MRFLKGEGERRAVLILAAVAVAILLLGAPGWIRRAQQGAAVAETTKHGWWRSGAIFGNRLWLVQSNDRVTSFDLGGKSMTMPQAGVNDIQAAPDAVWMLVVEHDKATALRNRTDTVRGPDGVDVELESVSEDPSGSFRLKRFADGQWRDSAAVHYAAGEQPASLAIDNGVPVVVASAALHYYDATADRWATRPIGSKYGWWDRRAVSFDRQHRLYTVRGALLRLGPTDTMLQPVDGTNWAVDVVADPQHEGCAIVADGDTYMWSGRLSRVCDDRSETIAERRSGPAWAVMKRWFESSNFRKVAPLSEPFLRVAIAPNGDIIALSPRAIYRIGPGGTVRTALPRYEAWQGLMAIRSIPGVLIVAGNARGAIDGNDGMPLLFALPQPR